VESIEPVAQSADGRAATSAAYAIRAAPNNLLQLTRLASGKLEKPCPPSSARMGHPLPEPPGS